MLTEFRDPTRLLLAFPESGDGGLGQRPGNYDDPIMQQKLFASGYSLKTSVKNIACPLRQSGEYAARGGTGYSLFF